MVIKKSSRELEVNAKGVKIYDYDLSNSLIGLSYQELEGRVPGVGTGINSVCKEWYFILAGAGYVTVDGKTDTIEAGDIVIIEPGQASYLDARDLKFLTITEPNWYKEQHQEVDHT